MQRKVPLADVPPWAEERAFHLDPDFVKSSIETVLKRQEYKGDAWAAAGRIEKKARRACER